jgi:uncharacterized protein (DUF3084 family)
MSPAAETNENNDLIYRMGKQEGILESILRNLEGFREDVSQVITRLAKVESDISALKTAQETLQKEQDAAGKERDANRTLNDKQQQEIVVIKKQFAWLMAAVGIAAGFLSSIASELLFSLF